MLQSLHAKVEPTPTTRVCSYMKATLLTVITTFLALLTAGTPLVQASPAAHLCPEEAMATVADTIVIATPLSLTSTQRGTMRETTVRYKVGSTVKGARGVKQGSVITVITSCDVTSQWSDHRGYPSDWCGFPKNSMIPGFAMSKPIKDARRTLFLTATGKQFTLNRTPGFYGGCPVLKDGDAIIAATKKALAIAPTYANETVAPFVNQTVPAPSQP